jgi:predicted nucleic acid-binding protein
VTTIWIDSSFAIEFLLGERRAAGVNLGSRQLVTLPAQYAEICAFFLRRDPGFDPTPLEQLELVAVDEGEALAAAKLYVAARTDGSKASLADAMLAAVVRSRGGELLAFDDDFRHLGMHRESSGRWSRA